MDIRLVEALVRLVDAVALIAVKVNLLVQQELDRKK